MVTKNKNQHFVPQYYLREFADLKEYVYVYDINNKKIFKQKVNGIAAKSFFYNVNVGLLNKFLDIPIQDDEQIIDKILNKKHEELNKKIIKSFQAVKLRADQGDDVEVISVIDFYALIDFMIILWIRNPKLNMLFNSVFVIVKEQLPEANEEEIISLVRSLFLLLTFEKLGYEYASSLKLSVKKSLNFISDEIKFLQKYLRKCKKIMCINFTELDFIASDCPIGVERNEENKELLFMYFPINSRVGFIFMNEVVMNIDCSSSLKFHLENDNEGIQMVKILNSSIIRRSNRHLFSRKDQFHCIPELEDMQYKSFWNL